MTKPRGPLPQLTKNQEALFIISDRDAERTLLATRRLLMHELVDAGWSHRMLAELYGVAHNTIRYWMRDPTEPERKRKR